LIGLYSQQQQAASYYYYHQLNQIKQQAPLVWISQQAAATDQDQATNSFGLDFPTSSSYGPKKNPWENEQEKETKSRTAKSE